jgi:carbamate kinase
MAKGEGLEAQWRRVREAARAVAGLVEKGYRVAVTHGNGPQVGLILEWVHAAPPHVARGVTLDIAVAMTQGWLGYMLQQAIGNELEERGLPRRVATIVTQVEVDPRDPAFADPTKPVGPFHDCEEARRLARETGWVFKPDPRGGCRRVVPSPRPLRVVEAEAVRRLLDEGYVVVAAGGGGIPVARGGRGLRGAEAVVDKDMASSLLARLLGADALVILTDVDYVYLDYGRPSQRPIRLMKASEARRLLEEGQFPPGTMGPKVEAAVEFVEARGPGSYAAIGGLEKALDVAEGRAGTRIVPG